MLKIVLGNEIPSKVSKKANPRLISRYYKNISETRTKKRELGAQHSTRNPNPVKIERDSRSYTTFNSIDSSFMCARHLSFC